MEQFLRTIQTIIPTPIFTWAQPTYHRILALAGALIYRFPSRHITVIGVTGTKGKSSTVELINAFLEEAGHKTALSSTIHFKIDKEYIDNMYKMSMPGRMVVQRLLRRAVNAGCTHIVMEITSQGYLQYRNKYIDLDTVVFTNIAPEHIDSHGSYDAYLKAKLEIVKEIEKSKKPHKTIVINRDDKESSKFLEIKCDERRLFGIEDALPYTLKKEGFDMTFQGEAMSSHLSGVFNIYNVLAAANAALAHSITKEQIRSALSKFTGIRGRVEKIDVGQDFTVIVDYAHTTDSLEKLYQVFENSRIIAVLGGTGGGRDNWKRKEMGRIADTYSESIILTNEDPYDEDPEQIVKDVAQGITSQTPVIIMDRRAAIREAISQARTGDVILITGKGTDPYIMGPKGTKEPWDDARVAREELIAQITGHTTE
ncbi:MAG: UDP-N-acetylmuramyl-tripeptide synthetase [Candidatus Taylorbacteria bacterium]|nr:UDP-N-acetylmuramyl-tripeptide synthetase [Candidatus Taylorbacteria bacterium]